MKSQFIFLTIVLSLNLTIALVMAIETTDGEPLIPGVEYVHPVNASGSFDEYAERFNATDVMDKWGATPFDGVPILGDIFSGGNQFWNVFGFLIDGVPSLLTWTGSFLPTSQAVFGLIADVVRVVTSVMFVTLVIEFISGRELLP